MYVQYCGKEGKCFGGKGIFDLAGETHINNIKIPVNISFF